MKKTALVALVLISSCSYAQKYGIEKAKAMFFSKTPVEDIDAKNTVVSSLFNTATGDIVFSMMMRDFAFKKSLMKEHFNEKYLETDKYPKSTFQGKLTGYSTEKAGKQEVRAIGKLTIHGVTKDVDVPGTLEFKDGKIEATSKFQVSLKDYDIKIPQLLWKKVAEVIDVNLDFTYKTL
jgi:polyisoprenoid-binding protein YceI